MTELQVVDIADARSARQRAQWLLELADVQEFTMERIGQRYFDWARLSSSAEEAASIFASIEVAEREVAAA